MLLAGRVASLDGKLPPGRGGDLGGGGQRFSASVTGGHGTPETGRPHRPPH